MLQIRSATLSVLIEMKLRSKHYRKWYIKCARFIWNSNQTNDRRKIESEAFVLYFCCSSEYFSFFFCFFLKQFAVICILLVCVSWFIVLGLYYIFSLVFLVWLTYSLSPTFYRFLSIAFIQVPHSSCLVTGYCKL